MTERGKLAVFVAALMVCIGPLFWGLDQVRAPSTDTGLPLLIVESSPVASGPTDPVTEAMAEPAVDPEVLDRWRRTLAANMAEFNRACIGSEVVSVACEGTLCAIQNTHMHFTNGSDSDRLEWYRHNPRILVELAGTALGLPDAAFPCTRWKQFTHDVSGQYVWLTIVSFTTEPTDAFEAPYCYAFDRSKLSNEHQYSYSPPPRHVALCNRLAIRAGLPPRYGPFTPVSDGVPEPVPDPVEVDGSSGT